ncbi:uncharacterized protein L969DRAFT_94802 [Mixia osmundae IAM 14324]|uniref:uncharacterized protein n=1 Tax=Mixia osmundae (strain CBS 9802 / IAM 14324 / JCM 22182 / KY 12970) TaxID=764103 RepID=UPI0004A54D5F|nr:uncharacterized protein L969DRAFT_94802 [Mixia osmundae IAM 14324]KEI39761.1 hypothetical protein L969DRAFT_94802 [Mixia osmundae IAM 14324]
MRADLARGSPVGPLITPELSCVNIYYVTRDKRTSQAVASSRRPVKDFSGRCEEPRQQCQSHVMSTKRVSRASRQQPPDGDIPIAGPAPGESSSANMGNGVSNNPVTPTHQLTETGKRSSSSPTGSASGRKRTASPKDEKARAAAARKTARMERNRIAAQDSRNRKKDYTRDLEKRVKLLEGILSNLGQLPADYEPLEVEGEKPDDRAGSSSRSTNVQIEPPRKRRRAGQDEQYYSSGNVPISRSPETPLRHDEGSALETPDYHDLLNPAKRQIDIDPQFQSNGADPERIARLDADNSAALRNTLAQDSRAGIEAIAAATSLQQFPTASLRSPVLPAPREGGSNGAGVSGVGMAFHAAEPLPLSDDIPTFSVPPAVTPSDLSIAAIEEAALSPVLFVSASTTSSSDDEEAQSEYAGLLVSPLAMSTRIESEVVSELSFSDVSDMSEGDNDSFDVLFDFEDYNASTPGSEQDLTDVTTPRSDLIDSPSCYPTVPVVERDTSLDSDVLSLLVKTDADLSRLQIFHSDASCGDLLAPPLYAKISLACSLEQSYLSNSVVDAHAILLDHSFSRQRLSVSARIDSLKSGSDSDSEA